MYQYIWLACYTIQKGARKWQRYHANTRGGIKTASFSGTTGTTGLFDLGVTIGQRTIIGISSNNAGHRLHPIVLNGENYIEACKYGGTNNEYVLLLKEIAISGTYYYIDNDSF